MIPLKAKIGLILLMACFPLVFSLLYRYLCYLRFVSILMSENTKQHTLKGLFWNAIDRFGNQLITTIVGIIVARVLDPSDFGVVGVLVIFSTVSTAFVDSGLATSLVRAQEIKDKDYSTMFAFNLLVSIFLYLVLFFSAPAIERFNDIPGLAVYARVMFLQLLIHAFGIVQYVKLLKSFSFQATARINVFAILFSGIIVVCLAVTGFGVWALLLQPVLYSLSRTVLLWVWGDWKLDLSFSKESLNRHLSFSLSFMVGSMLSKIFSPMYYSFIGKHFTTSLTGIYYQANKWGETPNLLLSSIVQGTTLATLAPIQHDFPRFLNACRKSVRSLAFVLFPVSFCAILVAEPAFVYFLGEKWRHSILFFQVLCFAGIFISLADMNVNFLNIKGRSRLTLWLEVFKIGLAGMVLWFTYKHGILYIVCGQLGIRLLFFFVSTFLSGRVYGFKIGLQLKDLLPAFFLSVIAFLVGCVPLYLFPQIGDLLIFLLQGLLFFAVYIVCSHLFKNEIWVELFELFKKKISKT